MSDLELLLVRHGRTAANVGLVMDSRPPGAPLDEVGIAEAQALAQRLTDVPVAGVYASIAIRSQQTAQPVADRLGLAVEVLPGVHEVFVGDLEGTSGAEAHAAYDRYFGAWAAGDYAARIPGGDSADDLVARFGASLERVFSEHRTGTVVIISHGGIIRVVARYLDPSVTGAMMIEGQLPNTGSVRLVGGSPDLAARDWRCVEWTGLTLDPQR